MIDKLINNLIEKCENSFDPQSEVALYNIIKQHPEFIAEEKALEIVDILSCKEASLFYLFHKHKVIKNIPDHLKVKWTAALIDKQADLESLGLK